MIGRVNCIYNDRGAWCTNKNISRCLFGLGARCCSEYPPLNGCKCPFKIKHPKPPSPPPPLTKKKQ